MNGMPRIHRALPAFLALPLLTCLLCTQVFGQNRYRDYGWMLDKDNALVYIVQVSPEQALQMQTDNLESTSNLPPDLVGRVTRIAVRIGTAELPRVPSLEEIRKMPRFTDTNDVTAALGAGRITELESSSVVNVQDPGAPRLPSFSDLGNAADNPIDRARMQAQSAEASAGQQFLAGAGGQSNPSLMLPDTGSSLSDLPSTSSKFENTAAGDALSGLPSRQGGANWSSANRDTSLSDRLGSSRNGPSSSPFSGSSAGEANRGPDFNAPADTRLTNTRAPTRNFGTSPAAYGQNGPQEYAGTRNDPRGNPGQSQPNVNTGYGGGGYGGGGYGNGSGSGNGYGNGGTGSFAGNGTSNTGYPGVGFGGARTPAVDRQEVAQVVAQELQPYLSQIVRLAGNLSGAQSGAQSQGNGLTNGANSGPGVPSNNPTTGAQNSNNSNAQGSPNQIASDSADRSPSSDVKGGRDENSTADGSLNSTTSAAARTGSVLVQMFFLVSLVANCYLVYLIRKLLMRYRSLLSTVRSHAV